MRARKIYEFVVVALEWFALIAQLVLHLQALELGIAESLIRFFSYFTILTNLLVAVYFTVKLMAGGGRRTGFFHRASVQTAIALYITVVGLIYNLVLRQLWDSEGLQAIVHDILHTVVPLLTIIYWWIWVDGRKLQFSNIPAWLVYPAVYALLVVARGNLAVWYPYPFLDVHKCGALQVIKNSGLLVLTFLFFGLLLVFLGRRKQPSAISL